MKNIRISTPISDEDIKEIRAGDNIYINGDIILARDEAHKRALEMKKQGKKLPMEINTGVLYHAGPVAVKDENNNWEMIAVGPTTSARMEMFEPIFIKNFNVKIILGKGGMSGETLETFRKQNTIYGAVTGGAALVWASKIDKVIQVEWLDLGIPEALWKIKVRDFGPILVAIDSVGNNIYKNVNDNISNNLNNVIKFLNIEE
ncbi:MAG: fumarate hydratase [Candidatus Lokiarchaeota archaeon]|nr:fumarate hydratase [Candidatus Lokiarchaeota archaeon]